MTKYHIKADGLPGICNAEQGNCPFGENAPHFDNIEAAQQFADLKNRIEVEEDFRLSKHEIYMIDEKESKTLIDSIDKMLDKVDKKLNDNEAFMERIRKTKDWKEYKQLEKDYKEATNERFRLINSSEKDEESKALMEEHINNIVSVHKFRDEEYLIDISSENYWIGKPKYTGYKVNEDGTLSAPMFLTNMPSHIVQKAFRSKANKDAFSEIKAANKICSSSLKERLKAYPPVEYNKKLEEAVAKEEKAAKEYKDKENTETIKEFNDRASENWYKLEPRRKELEDQKEEIMNAQEDIRAFHNLGGNHRKGNYGQFLDDNDEILVRAREQGIEQPVRHIQHRHFLASMADSISQTRREQEQLEERYDPVLRRYGLGYWNGNLHLVD